ncbi:hypothetical protein BC828DRAFT_374962 [Blastocladiella britannica]|nr:hypothetical protein BC828DRAFT_374962 [Blastocladiella britannica]
MFQTVSATFYVHLPPKFMLSPSKGVEDHLNRMLLKFNERLGGVILSYSNVSFLSDRAEILYDSPFAHFSVQCDMLLFAPEVGSRIRGIINKQSPTHIGLLVSNLFNASIPKADIPESTFAFTSDDGSAAPAEAEETPSGHHARRRSRNTGAAALSGHWVHSASHTMLDVGTELEFVVTGVHRAHDFVNISGSLVDVDFVPSPAPIARAAAAPANLVTFGDEEEELVGEAAPIAKPTAAEGKGKRKRKLSETTDVAPAAAAEIAVEEGQPPAKKSKKAKAKKQAAE